ncbi:MAG: hypothetical protein KAJ03_04580 [Gammaproteobacteria bacterium]|nr:hypothetical protein [Gammaproteobacteria bacterium]
MKRSDVSTVKLGGMTVDQLPIAERAQTLPQLKKVEENQRQNEIAGIKAQYPEHPVGYCTAKIKEAACNQQKIQQMRDENVQKISEYQGLIVGCEHRDKMLDGETDKVLIRKLNKQFPPYNVAAMQQQITQFEEAITRCDDVIAQEVESVRVLGGLQVLCERRDAELKALGA